MPKYPRLNLILLLVVLLASTALRPSPILSIWAQSSATDGPKDNAELTRLYQEDQADRAPQTGPVDGKAIVARDQARQARVKELYQANQMQTGADYYHAAMVLQHGYVPEDYLLAHELSVVGLSKGEAKAKWLAAASEDRFLMAIGRPQRFATQYRSDSPGLPMHLYQVDEGVTDELRRAMNARPLAEAKAQEQRMNPKKD